MSPGCVGAPCSLPRAPSLGLAVLSETGDGLRNLYVVDGFKDPMPLCVLRDLPRTRCLLVVDKTVGDTRPRPVDDKPQPLPPPPPLVSLSLPIHPCTHPPCQDPSPWFHPPAHTLPTSVALADCLFPLL